MSRPIVLKSTLDTIDLISFALSNHHDLSNWHRLYYWRDSDALSLDAVRQRLIFLNKYLETFEGRAFREVAEREASTDWLFYEGEQEIIPIYDEALAVVSRQLIVPPSEIPHVLAFMGILNTNTGIDAENHDGKGYHFHYGKVKRNSLKRYDVLLTFDKRDVGQDKQPIPDIPLHIEPHAAGKCVHIDASTIGHNRRLPIYLVCINAMKSRGLANFLTPSSNSWQFYPAV